MIDFSLFTGDVLSQFQTQVYVDQLFWAKLSFGISSILSIGAIVVTIVISYKQHKMANSLTKIQASIGSVNTLLNKGISGNGPITVSSGGKNIQIYVNSVDEAIDMVKKIDTIDIPHQSNPSQ